MNPKDLIAQKVEDFAKNEKFYKSKEFQETEVRTRFIDPFFEALGWNLNQTDVPRKFWDVLREYSQKDNSTTKKPDYAFRINGKLQFFVEAKAPYVALTDKDPVFQAKRYAFSTNGKAPIIILTDFEEFRVFNALEKPIYDNPRQGILPEFDFRYVDYLDKWELLWETFSREAVANGSLERLRGKIAKNTKKLDEEFLEQITGWREILAKSLAIKNETLNADALNEAVQRILDRLIFIRQLEDRSILEENTLLQYTNKENIYKDLKILFDELNGKFNGILFKPHFSEGLNVEDKIIKNIISELCYPRSPFQFDVIEPEILGRIYERFLGSKIRLTESHRAKVEEKPEVRHAGGVYYTPEYIVNYIVKETLGKKLEGKTPDEVAQLKILDPACGSGSFLLGAYGYLLDYHREYYKSLVVVHKSQTKDEIPRRTVPTKFKEDFYITSDGEVKLTTKKKGEILVNNIYGVDVDREATEVAILSLYLKLLEDGIEDDGLLFLKGNILPDMSANIKCGNSLISREDLWNLSDSLLTDLSLKPLDWAQEFPTVMKAGGFDCVIGNPPYIRIQEMQKWAEKEVKLYKEIYKAGKSNNFDIYVLFIEKGLQLLNFTGKMGFIVPNKFMQQEYGKGIREILVNSQVVYKIIDFKHYQVFENATIYTCLLFLDNSKVTEIEYAEANTGDLNHLVFVKQNPKELSKEPWNFYSKEDEKLYQILKSFKTVKDIAENIFVGIQTSADKVFILKYISESDYGIKLYSNSLQREVNLERKYLRHIISGTDVKRYTNPVKTQYVIFPYEVTEGKSKLLDKKILEQEVPSTWEYLLENKKILENRENGKLKGKGWWGYIYLKNMTIQDQPKLCIPRLVQRIQCIYDEYGDFCLDNVDVGGIILKTEYKPLYHYLMGLLNSKLLSVFLSKISTPFRGGFWSCNKHFIEKLPIYLPDPTDKERFALTQKIESLVKQILELRSKGRIADAEFLETKIDQMVEKLYGVEVS
ncbi:MAG: Eco57I restriction-modification methylase domain-containing protein [Leptospiraceae bacterium]|nr:Eco57I restriction-modification methylase domain-containing protein [Leptospiraceae bacterium]